MRNLFITLLLLASLTTSINGQIISETFGYGRILSNNDTLECLVNLSPSYSKYILYKLTEEGKTYKANIDSVNFVITNYNCYGKIHYKNRQTLSRILYWGRIKYYAHHIIAPPKRIPNKEGRYISYSDDKYYIKKDSTIILIKKSKITDDVKMLFKDNDTIYNKIIKKGLKRKELEKLIEEYNNANPKEIDFNKVKKE
mgnify:CR=1 FL=1